MAEIRDTANAPPTIYDVAHAAGVSIASVSRVLNGQAGTRVRKPGNEYCKAVGRAGLRAGRRGSGAERPAQGGSRRRRPANAPGEMSEGAFADEDESLQFPDMINRGIEVVASRRGFDMLVRSVDLGDHGSSGRILSLARKSDGLILHDRLLEPDQLARLSRQVPIVTLAGLPTETTANVRGDNRAGMRDLARHLLGQHGYRTVAYLGGHSDSPDSVARHEVLAAELSAAGATLLDGPEWQGNYLAVGGARVIDRLIDRRAPMPQVIACANDQTALGVMYALAARGIDVPGQVAVTGFDDIPVARHLRPQLTTVRQPIQELGTTAFEILYSMISTGQPTSREVALPTRLIVRESCGCPPDLAPPAWRTTER